MKNETSKYAILAVITMASFLSAFASSSVNVALPVIARELSLDAILLSWIPTSFLLASAMFLIPFGRFADIHGRKKVFTFGVMIYFIGSIFAVLINNGLFLIATRALQGIGGAMIFATGGPILMSSFQPGERGKVIGINTASVYLGLSSGPFFGGILTHRYGWHSIFIVSAALALFIFPIIIFKIHDEWADARGERFDLAGAFIYGISISAMIIGFSFLPEVKGYAITIPGVTGIIVFVIFEYKVKVPLLKIALFVKNRVFAFSNIATMINYSATFSVGFYLSLYLQYAKGYSVQKAGFILVAQPITQALLSPIAGHMSDKIEPKFLSSTGMALTAAALCLLIFIDRDTSIGIILLSLIIFGFGLALFSSPNTNIVLSSVDRKFYGTAASINGTMRFFGQMMSMALATLFTALYIGHVQISAQNADALIKSMQTAFLLFTFLSLSGIYFSLSSGKMHK